MSLVDHIVSFHLTELPVRGRLIMCDQVTRDVLDKHAYPTEIAKPLAEALVFTALMSSTLKNEEGIFTLQIQGDGPLSLLVTDATYHGAMRGYARFTDAQSLKGLDFRALTKNAQLVFTLDDRTKHDRYQGVVELVGSTLTDALQHYFSQSEQSLTCLTLKSSAEGKASGLYLQWLPDAQDDPELVRDQWLYVMSVVGSITKDEFIAGKLEPEALLHRLFHDQGLVIHKTKPLKAECRCSKTKIEAVLASLPADEKKELEEDGVIKVTCEFCSQTYVFGGERGS